MAQHGIRQRIPNAARAKHQRKRRPTGLAEQAGVAHARFGGGSFRHQRCASHGLRQF
ncbi:MAG: hypothetical protein ACK559_32480 [bacterium]